MESTENYPFVLHWVWGHQTNIAPVNISNQKEKEMFYVSGSIGIYYDWIRNKQYLLQGHKNDIISIVATPDKKYLVSSDCGEENCLIIWDARKRTIFHVIYDYYPQEGVISMGFSSDSHKLITLDAGKPQELAIWDWQRKKKVPDFTYKYEEEADFQHYVIFHPVHSSHFCSSGVKNVYFFEKEEDKVKSAVLDIKNMYDEKVINQIGDFTQTAFSLVSSLAFTATTKGTVVFWGRPLYSREKPLPDSIDWFLLSPEQRVCIRVLQAMDCKCSISYFNALDNYIIAGTEKGDILCYDEDFNVKWSKNFNKGHINGISFTYKPKVGLKGAVKRLLGKEVKSKEFYIEENDFIISTVEGYVGYFCVSSQELTQVLWGTNHLIKNVTVHPLWPFLYFGDYSGRLQKWDYKSKKLINEDIYKGACSEIELITVDSKGCYTACVMSNGHVVIFDAICFSAQPCFFAEEVLHKPTMIKFSPDSQQLLIIDMSSYVICYRLQLLVSLKVFQMLKKDKAPPEEPFWSYSGKTRQHQGNIVDCMFNDLEKDETIYFYTLGEDRFLVEYNISNSKGLDIDVSKRIVLERKPVPTCMAWYSLPEVSSLIAVLNDDGKLRIYCTESEKCVRLVSLPTYDEPINRIILQRKLKILLTKEFPNCLDVNAVFEFFIFKCCHMLGISKHPIDGNPNTSLGISSTPSGINCIVPNKEQTFLFTAGLHDSWVFMYEINIKALLEAEKEGGEGVDAFKYLFPSNTDPDEMKKRLIYSVYSLELEMKMLKLGEEEPVLKGEVPIAFLEYILAALGCFLTPADLQNMLKDIEFESKYHYNGKKRTLSCLDIMKLYVNYRPPVPVTKLKLQETFRDILALEEDPDQMPRARFIDILSTRGDAISQNDLEKMLKCLQSIDSSAVVEDEYDEFSGDEETAYKPDVEEETTEITTDKESDLKTLIPEFVTEEIFFRNILCLESKEEDLSKYILKKEDHKLVQEYPKLEEFVSVIEKSF